MLSYERKVLHYVVGGRDLYKDWVDGLDRSARIAIYKRIDRVEDGNLGDHRSVGEGVWELRIHYGPGYRIYYGEDGPDIILLLCGGDKSSQERDIQKAHRLWAGHGRGK